MSTIYRWCGVTRQSHWKAMQHLRLRESLASCYVGFILEARELHPGMGLRAIYEQFNPEGIGRDAFIELGLQEGFRLRAHEQPHRTTFSVKNNRYRNLLEGKRFTGVNQLWVSDLFYFRLGNRHYYVVLIMDVYSRAIIGYSVADNMRAENNVAALNMALDSRGVENYNGSLIHHSDRGGQYVSDVYTDTLDSSGILVSMCNDVLENSHCERVNGTIKNDYLMRWTIKTPAELTRRVKDAVNNYNNRRHRSLGCTPLQYEAGLLLIPAEKRKEMQIFTIKQNDLTSMQLKLNLDYN